MELNELIQKDFDSLYKKVNSSLGKSKKTLYSFGFEQLNILDKLVNGKYSVNPFNTYGSPLAIHEIINDKLFNLVFECIKGYQDMDFKYLGKRYVSISQNDKNDIIREFLEYLGAPFFDLYKSLYGDNRIVYVNDPNWDGMAVAIISLNSYYLCISNNCCQDDLDIIITTIHELAHIYSSKFLSNYRQPKERLREFLYVESLSLTFELLLYYYLVEHHIFPKEVRLSRNDDDDFILYLYEEIYYFLKALQMNDTSFSFDGFKYKIEGDIVIDDFEVYRQFGNYFKDGNLEHFSHAIGSIKAHELCDILLNSNDKVRIINEFLMTFQYEVIFQEEELNPQIMLEGVKSRNKELKNIYRI